MCLFTDLQTLDKMDEKSIIAYLENLCEYVVVPKTTIDKIESLLNGIKEVAPNE